MNFDLIAQRLGGLQPAGGGDFTPVPESELYNIEQQIKAKLPSDYRALLSQFGAFAFNGRSENNPFIYFKSLTDLPSYIADEGLALLRFFYGKTQNNGPFGLLEKINNLYGRIPNTMIPIADDGGAGEICLGIKGEDICKVFYWDLANEPLDSEAYFDEYGKPTPEGYERQNIYCVAYTLEDFFNRLAMAPE